MEGGGYELGRRELETCVLVKFAIVPATTTAIIIS